MGSHLTGSEVTLVIACVPSLFCLLAEVPWTSRWFRGTQVKETADGAGGASVLLVDICLIFWPGPLGSELDPLSSGCKAVLPELRAWKACLLVPVGPATNFMRMGS